MITIRHKSQFSFFVSIVLILSGCFESKSNVDEGNIKNSLGENISNASESSEPVQKTVLIEPGASQEVSTRDISASVEEGAFGAPVYFSLLSIENGDKLIDVYPEIGLATKAVIVSSTDLEGNEIPDNQLNSEITLQFTVDNAENIDVKIRKPSDSDFSSVDVSTFSVEQVSSDSYRVKVSIRSANVIVAVYSDSPKVISPTSKIIASYGEDIIGSGSGSSGGGTSGGGESGSGTNGSTSGDVTSEDFVVPEEQVVVNGDQSSTSSTTINITFNVEGAEQVYVTSDEGCASGGVWESYTTSKNWELKSLNALNKIFYKFKKKGGIETACSYQTVLHDDVPPAEPVVSAPNPIVGNASDTFVFKTSFAGATNVQLEGSDLTVHTTGTLECGDPIITAGTTLNPEISISGCSGSGELSVSIRDGVATDEAGNISPATVSGAATVAAGPSIAATQNVDAANSLATVTYQLTYTNAASVNLTAGDITLTNSAGVSCGAPTVLSGTTLTPTISVSGCTGNGSFYLEIAASTAVDALGQNAPSFTTGTVSVDNTAPNLTIVSPSSGGNSSSIFTFALTYVGASQVSLQNTDITVNPTGSVFCSDVAVTGGSTLSPSVQVSGCSGDGTFTIDVASARASDEAANTDSGASSAAVPVDNTRPMLTVSQPTPSNGNALTNFSFSVAVSGASTILLESADVEILSSSPLSCNSPVVTDGSTANPTVTVDGCSGQSSSFRIRIMKNVATDEYGNGNFASTSGYATLTTGAQASNTKIYLVGAMPFSSIS